MKRSKTFKRRAGGWRCPGSFLDYRQLPVSKFSIPRTATEIQFVAQAKPTKHSVPIFMIGSGAFVDLGSTKECNSLPALRRSALPGWGIQHNKVKKFHVEVEHDG